MPSINWRDYATDEESYMFVLKTMIKDCRQVNFVRYKEGELWYATEDDFEFPVPVADVGGATMLAKNWALLFMRHLRRHLAMLEQAREHAAHQAIE